MDSPQNIISFCTGYGGIELGLRLAGINFRTVCYVEIEAFPQANLVAKIEQGKMDAAPIWSNLKTFPAQSFSGKVHGIIGGYPCQPFSHAGQRKGTDDPRHLWPYIEQHIRTIRPVWCFFENVGGHLSLGFYEVFTSLRNMGYKVEAGLFTAAEVGASHKRERLFILAYAGCNEQAGISGNCKKEDGEAQRGRSSDRRDPQSIPSCDGGLDNAKCKHGRLHTEECVNDTQIRSADKAMADTDTGRSRQNRQQCELRTDSVGESSCDTWGSESIEEKQRRWPAGPGPQQHKWEEPRTVKSGMGRTINGFASRVDELRLLGNGVVPQTAELAYRTLSAL